MSEHLSITKKAFIAAWLTPGAYTDDIIACNVEIQFMLSHKLNALSGNLNISDSFFSKLLII